MSLDRPEGSENIPLKLRPRDVIVADRPTLIYEIMRQHLLLLVGRVFLPLC